MSKSRWYIIKVLSGHESKVRDAIERELVRVGLSDSIEEFLIPSEQITRLTKGKKITVEKKFYPGYIFIKAEIDQVVWSIIRSNAKGGDLLCNNGKPLPALNSEIESIKSQLAKGVSISDLEVRFDVAESVKIVEGAFKSFIGVVEEIDAAKQKLKITVSIFGRNTPVELGYDQVQKL